jgi:hypothetical protein
MKKGYHIYLGFAPSKYMAFITGAKMKALGKYMKSQDVSQTLYYN